MQFNKSLAVLGSLVLLVAFGIIARMVIVGIPPRSQSALVSATLQRNAVSTQKAVISNEIAPVAPTTTNKISTQTSGGPVGIALNDLCSNFDGIQSVIPAGYQQDVNNNCVCPAGQVGLIATGAPAGTIPACVTLPKPKLVQVKDLCPNIAGTQGMMPLGYHIVEGQCVRKDLCPNIAGVQATVPAGYDVVGGQCTPIPPAGICFQPNKSFLVGGHNRSYGFADMWSYISSASQWTPITTPTFSLGDISHHASAIFNNKLWIFGGVSTNPNSTGYTPSNAVWTYNGTAWTQDTTPLWTARYDHSAIVFQNKLWLMGGSDSTSGQPSNPAWANVFGDTWSFNGTTWTRFDNDINTAGIQDAPWVVSAVPMNIIFQLNGGSTVTMEKGKTAFKTAVFQNQLWLMGGSEKYHLTNVQGNITYVGATNVNDVWSFDGNTWTPHGSAPWGARSDFILVPFQNKLWLIGGEDTVGNASSSSTYNDVWSFDGVTWTQFDHDLVTPGIQNAPWQARAQYSGIVSNGKIYITGGDPNSDPMLNDVWSFNGSAWTKVDNNTTTAGVQDAPWAVRDGMSWVACQ